MTADGFAAGGTGRVRVGVDVGGTFTDFVVVGDDGTMRSHKVLSTPEAPERAVLQGLSELGLRPPFTVVHGSTVATNAFLERKGARLALVATEGFEDVLEIGRQDRVGIYDLRARKPAPLVPPEARVGARERLAYSGEVLEPLTPAEAMRVQGALDALAPEAVAVVLLHAYANPVHEERIREALAGRPHVYLSSRVDPAYREYERASTTAITAYVAPVVEGYLTRLGQALGTDLRVMASGGGHQSVARILERPAAMMLSGPAGGAVGALAVGRRIGLERLVTFDMGGTSTDVALLRGGLTVTREGRFDDLPLRAAMVDVHTVGAGGGSIARFDAGGSLRVGPQSAGASPGPACYGRGGRDATVTDANLLLGRLGADHFLGGRARLDRAAADEAFARLAEAARAAGAGEPTPRALAEGVVAVANAAMARAIRKVTAERGIDPAPYTLVSFGGAGGLHAAALAAALGMAEVIVPPDAGTLSAFGLALADSLGDGLESVLLPAAEASEGEIRARLEALAGALTDSLRAEGYTPNRIAIEPHLDLRYRGESYELLTPWRGDVAATVEAFHALHREQYMHADRDAPVECVNVYVRALGREGEGGRGPWRGRGDGRPFDVRPAVFEGRERATACFERETLPAGWRVEGPALVFDPSATSLVPPGGRAWLDGVGVLHIRAAGEADGR